MEVILVPDVKPEVDDLAGRTGRGDESSVTGQIESSDPKVTGAQSNNNTIKILNTKTLHPGQISTNSGSAGGTVYISSGGSLTTGSPVRTSTILTTPVGQQQLQAMAKSSGLNVVHVTLPQSVIQSPSSVIQSASGQIQLSKGNVILLSKPHPGSGVIQTTGGALQAVQLLESQQSHLNSDESISNDGIEHPTNRGGGEKKRREILTRRPSYRKILNDLGGAEITGERGDSSATSESSQDGLDGSGNIIVGGQQYPQPVVKVINANTLGLGSVTSAESSNVPATSLQTITMTNAGTGGTIVQYAHPEGQPFYVPVGGELQTYTLRPMSSANTNSPSVVVHGPSGHSNPHHHPPEEQTRKREIRLLKNREAARECRRKKKEYIKCLENRVAVLENQNKALIDELKSLKELYCQQKVE